MTSYFANCCSGASRRKGTGNTRVHSGRGLSSVDVRALWRDWSTLPTTVAYPVAGALIEMLHRDGGLPALRALLRTQTLDDARRIYGPALDGWLDAFQARLTARVRAASPASGAP